MNELASVERDPNTFYAATEWGGIYKIDGPRPDLARLDGHLPVATWDVEVFPSDPERVIATSFYDGRVASQAGHQREQRRRRDVDKAGHPAPTRRLLYAPHAATSRLRSASASTGAIPIACMLERIAAWRSATTPARRGPLSTRRRMNRRPTSGMWSRTTGGSSTSAATTGTFAPSMPAPHGRRAADCRPAFAPSRPRPTSTTSCLRPSARTSGRPTTAAAAGLGSARPIRVARDAFPLSKPIRVRCREPIPGVRSLVRRCPAVSRGLSQRPARRGPPCPMATTGAVLPPTPPAGWDGPFTRSAGGHDDVGAIVFAPGASENACPVLFSSDGGVYFNTKRRARLATVHFGSNRMSRPCAVAMALAGFDQPGVRAEDLYFGNQDNGTFRHDQRRGPTAPGRIGMLRRLRRQLQSFARPLHNLLFLSPAWKSPIPSQSRHGGRSRDKHVSARHPSGFPTH